MHRPRTEWKQEEATCPQQSIAAQLQRTSAQQGASRLLREQQKGNVSPTQGKAVCHSGSTHPHMCPAVLSPPRVHWPGGCFGNAPTGVEETRYPPGHSTPPLNHSLVKESKLRAWVFINAPKTQRGTKTEGNTTKGEAISAGGPLGAGAYGSGHAGGAPPLHWHWNR